MAAMTNTPPFLPSRARPVRRGPVDLSNTAIRPDELAAPSSSTELGEQAVELLMAELGGSDVPGATLLPPRMTERASTAPRALA